MQISLVATHKLAAGLNPRLPTCLNSSWCFLCYSLKIEFLMWTTKVCFDSHAFRWAAMSCQFSLLEWHKYIQPLLYSEGFRSFTKVLLDYFDILKVPCLIWISPSISFSSNLFTDLHHSKASKIRYLIPQPLVWSGRFRVLHQLFRRWKHRTVSLLHFCLAQWRPWSYVGEDWFPDPQNNINNTYTLGAFGRYVIKMSQRRKFWLNLVSLFSSLRGHTKHQTSLWKSEDRGLQAEIWRAFGVWDGTFCTGSTSTSRQPSAFFIHFIMLYLNTFERFRYGHPHIVSFVLLHSLQMCGKVQTLSLR